MRRTFLTLSFLFLLASACLSFGEPAGGAGRGGGFIEYHTASLSNFDPSVTGNPIAVGGEGYTYVSKNFRVGGAGAAAFLMNASDSTSFGMGYGGIVGQYVFAPWISVGLMVGGGAYAISKVTASSDTSSMINTLAADGFLLIKPDLTLEAPINTWFRLGASVALFLPNVSKLQSVNVGLHFIFGRY